ncbi:ferredoxin [Bradyrhizobium sp. SSBR45G]|uniref:2Fe-2S iron-sulfur cluster-binding protein n=1 Tax=unclassified Bradyrhizobium TaxID=2631580 RepID=UPI0023429812|nr:MULTISPECIES: 2Fe-2S iron-sulfur cluster-binding protein [unclassified Bradyrhizobium]GLH77204.1 ferredoxin [Bradyrhizobium sp. SSBR45G]GLH83962.1 ferredoxin [Bradyrhizobium sp. SSBR45R]
MPRITFIEPDGTLRTVDAERDESAMQAAKRNSVDGIIGECGGSCICATCHCHVDAAWIDRVGPAGDIEADVLEFEATDVRPESRLACQIAITDALDGLKLHVVGRSR